jgi:hypothetical protein
MTSKNVDLHALRKWWKVIQSSRFLSFAKQTALCRRKFGMPKAVISDH